MSKASNKVPAEGKGSYNFYASKNCKVPAEGKGSYNFYASKNCKVPAEGKGSYNFYASKNCKVPAEGRVLINETPKMIGQLIRICGWVKTKRDHGQMMFIDIRDRTGCLQVVCREDKCSLGKKELDKKNSFNKAKEVKIESAVEIIGIIKERPLKMQNLKIETGTIELEIKELGILSQAKDLPFEINDTKDVNEEIRLKYRYLDLRTERVKKNLIFRHKAIKYIRDFMDKKDFIEINTPLLSKYTPEGAREFAIPSRLHLGKFYTLPQSPQQYKQLLMVAGFERYFQIAPCFRDEAARADRSPGEFYQLDIEMAFVTQEDILNLIEEMFIKLVEKLLPDRKITKIPWPRLTHEQAMKEYGSDKPDIRKDKSDLKELGFCWIVDFPLFVKQTKQDFFYGVGSKLAPSHHMFTAPKEEDIKLLDKDPLKVKSYQHDLALNGIEIGGGSIRIHSSKLQEKIFEIIGFSKKQKEQFSHLLTAFEYGVPPHGGIAPGVDRLIRILLGEENIREVIAFPMSGDARDLMMGTPTEISKEQLKELHIKIVKN